MMLKLAKRLPTETDKRLLWKLAWNMGLKGMLSVQRHKRRLKRGEFFPPFLYVSVINSLQPALPGLLGGRGRQAGDRSSRRRSTSWSAKPRRWATSSSASSAASRSCTRSCSTCSSRHPDCYFQIFTNGHFITDEKAKRLRQLGNVTPLISVEGTEIVSDERRGRAGVLSARRCRASRTA